MSEERPHASARQARAPRRKLAGIIAASVAIAMLLIGGIDAASAQSLPGQPLYAWKTAHENIAMMLTTDPNARNALLVEYAQRRLIEGQMLNAGDAPAATSVPRD